MPKFDETSILTLGAEPIPGGPPAGIDAADDENYIVVMGEMSKLGRIEGDPPDWYTLESAATVFLQSKSKDVEIAAALGHALFKQKGYWGLAAVLKLLSNMVVTFWEGLFPERPRRRKARIESLMDVFTDGGWFRENQPKPDDFDALDACVERIEELNAALCERMPDDKPEFDKFIRALKELAAKRPKPSEPAPAQASSPSGGAASPSPSGGGGAAFASPEVADVNSAENAIDKAAAFIKKADVTNPLPYAVSRIIKWSMIQMPASDEGKFQIPPPEASVVDAIQHQAANALWDHLLTSAEGAFRTEDPLWLDLQRHTCNAMAGLGPQYNNARHVIMAMTAGLVRKLGSGLFELRFRNGTPLCSGDTKMWIESELLGGSGGGGGSGSMSNGKLSEATDAARKLAGSGKLKEAVAALQEGLASCSQRRDRFLWRFQIAQLCFDAQRIQLALPLLEECFEDVKRYHIEEWEPTIAVEVAQTLYRCRKALAVLLKEPAPEMEPGVRESFAWLCQLDPSAALAVEPSGK